MQAGALEFLPLWVLFLLTIIMSLLSMGLGFRAGLWKSGSGDNGPLGPIATGTLGLLAFVLALSYGTASSNYEIARQLVLVDVFYDRIASGAPKHGVSAANDGPPAKAEPAGKMRGFWLQLPPKQVLDIIASKLISVRIFWPLTQ